MTYEPLKPWHPGGGGLYTTSPDYFVIPVFDDFVGRIRLLDPLKQERKRNAWREARNGALDAWAQAGLRFMVSEGTYRWVWDDGANHDLEMLGQFDRGAIVLRRLKQEESVGLGQYIEQYGGVDVRLGICSFDIWAIKNLVAGMKAHVSGVICHEVGHVLGFGHNGSHAEEPGDSNDGVMALGYGGGDFRPSEEELDAVRRYYFG